MAKDRIQALAVFYEAQDSTLKALGHDPRLRFFIGQDNSADNEHSIRCPSLTIHPTESAVQQMRGSQDRLAISRRYAWTGYADIAAQHQLPMAWLAELEQIRAEALACDYLSGVKADLQAFYRHRQDKGLTELFSDRRRQDIFACLRFRLAGLGEECSQMDAADNQPLEKFIPRLKNSLHSPGEFHRQAAMLGQALAIAGQEAENTSTQLVPEEAEPPGKETSSLHLEETEQGEEPGEVPQRLKLEEDVAQGYRVFSRAHDEQCQAQELAGEDEQQALRAQLDKAIREARPAMSRLAGRLLHTLYANTRTDWEQEQEEGLLETARLDRLIANPLYASPYRQPRRHAYRDTVVSLLLDNSGSMRGHAITVAAMCADMLARTLERCGVGVEVLGYTTSDWRGGQVRQQWVKQGKPPAPGRLNSLRHIVYKSADQPWRRARNALAVMLKEDLLKENIDGEALQWASSRLRQRAEARRILIVISDGAPSDEASNEANGSNYLQEHLREVVQGMEEKSDVELMAIGIGYDVTGIYRNAVTIPAEGQLGDTLISQLCNLFTYGGTNTRLYRKRKHASIWSGAARRSLML